MAGANGRSEGAGTRPDPPPITLCRDEGNSPLTYVQRGTVTWDGGHFVISEALREYLKALCAASDAATEPADGIMDLLIPQKPASHYFDLLPAVLQTMGGDEIAVGRVMDELHNAWMRKIVRLAVGATTSVAGFRNLQNDVLVEGFAKYPDQKFQLLGASEEYEVAVEAAIKSSAASFCMRTQPPATAESGPALDYGSPKQDGSSEATAPGRRRKRVASPPEQPDLDAATSRSQGG